MIDVVYFLLLQMSLTAALSTDWSLSRRRSGEQAVAAVHLRSDKSGNSRLRGPERQRLYAAPDEMELVHSHLRGGTRAKATFLFLKDINRNRPILAIFHGMIYSGGP